MVDAADDSLSVLEARLHYWRANGFGDDGGYTKKIEWIPVGPLTIPIPNIAARVRALRCHDIHHLLTEYATDLAGEFEISAWELGAGCGTAWFAWMINLGGLLVGLLWIPRRVLRAFLRGRHSGSLYHLDIEAIERRSLADARLQLRLDQAPLRWRPSDVVALLALTILSVLWALLQIAFIAAPVVLLLWFVFG
jgi:hypothetical protein